MTLSPCSNEATGMNKTWRKREELKYKLPLKNVAYKYKGKLPLCNSILFGLRGLSFNRYSRVDYVCNTTKVNKEKL